MPDETKRRTTAVRRRGNRLGFWFFEVSLGLFGLSGTYGLLYFVCLYYMIVDRAAVTACMAYIKRRFEGVHWSQRILGVYRIFIHQGKNLIDRFYLVSGLGKFDIELIGDDEIRALLKNSAQGFILLTAHVGNWQVCMNSLERFGRTVHLLMRPEDNPAVRETLNIDTDSPTIRVISPEGFLGGVVESVQAINRGDIVCMMGDRGYGAPTLDVHFLGDRALFPYGAFSIAAKVRCPVVILLSSKVGAKKYVVDVSNILKPTYRSKQRKREELKTWVQRFSNILEGYLVIYPYQWFMFHDIWDVGNTRQEEPLRTTTS